MCKFCKNIKNYEEYQDYLLESGILYDIEDGKYWMITNHDRDNFQDAIAIEFCPMCGRKLVEENKHNIGLKIATNKPPRVECYIDKSRVNVIRIENKEAKQNGIFDFELEGIMEFSDLNGIIRVMNKETFDRFCKLWKDIHDSSK